MERKNLINVTLLIGEAREMEGIIDLSKQKARIRRVRRVIQTLLDENDKKIHNNIMIISIIHETKRRAGRGGRL